MLCYLEKRGFFQFYDINYHKKCDPSADTLRTRQKLGVCVWFVALSVALILILCTCYTAEESQSEKS